jgi:hypothetical protein
MATKLKSTRVDDEGKVVARGTEVERLTADGKLIVELTVQGLMIREKGRRLKVGPFPYALLYQQGVQRAQGLEPLRPKGRAGKRVTKVSRGLLAVGDG